MEQAPEKRSRAKRLQTWFETYEGSISTIALVGGFVLDWLMLQRIDTPFENTLIVIRLIVVGASIIFLNRQSLRVIDTDKEAKIHFWLINIIQFAFGGLLSTFLVFYFRSSSIFVSWPFLLLLLLAFSVNERLKHHYERASFQISFLFISIYSFTIFFVPILVRDIGPLVFLLSGALSLLIIFLYLKLLRYFTPVIFKESKKVLVLSIGTIFFLINALYFLNLIPPIPLSIKDIGVYHSIMKNADGDFVVAEEESNAWKRFFSIYKDVHINPGEPISVYSAIFSPTKLDIGIVHEWQLYDEVSRRWISKSRIALSVVGGRGDGFRTFSTHTELIKGSWRVNVETERGQVLGRAHFDVLPATLPLDLEMSIKY